MTKHNRPPLLRGYLLKLVDFINIAPTHNLPAKVVPRPLEISLQIKFRLSSSREGPFFFILSVPKASLVLALRIHKSILKDCLDPSLDHIYSSCWGALIFPRPCVNLLQLTNISQYLSGKSGKGKDCGLVD